jgi:aryl carrier-like protein
VGFTTVYPEVIRAEVAELLGVGVDAVDPNNRLIRRGRDSIRMARVGRWRWQGVTIGCGAMAGSPTNEAFPLASIEHALRLGRHNEQQLGGVVNCPDRVTSESWVGGRGKARGYRGSPNPTAEPDARCTRRRVAGQRPGLHGGAMGSVAEQRDCRRGRDRPRRALRPGGDGFRRGPQR